MSSLTSARPGPGPARHLLSPGATRLVGMTAAEVSFANASLMDVFRLFPDDDAAEKWIAETRWPDGIACVKCGSCNVQTKTTHPRMPYRCRDCRKFFSPKTGEVVPPISPW